MNKTYPINYDQNGFFSSDPNIVATFPFQLSAAIEWAQQAPQRPLDRTGSANIVDIFDSDLSDVITNDGNKTDFIDKFLIGNIYLNNTFGSVGVSTTAVVNRSINSESSININGTSYNGTKITSDNGSVSYLLGVASTDTAKSKTRVLYQPVCTINHLHFPKGCSVQQVISASTDESYYKCICSGMPVFDNSPHSHCREINNSISDPMEAINASYATQGGINSKNSLTGGGSYGSDYTESHGDGQKFNVDYTNSSNLKDTDRLIRQAIYEYYCAVIKNLKYKNALEKNQTISDTANQSLMDSNIKYKNQYLTAFNLLSGIIIAGGYIYVLSKSSV